MVVKSNSVFLALSRRRQEELAAIGLPAEDNIRQLTNGVDTSVFVPPESTNRQRDRTVLFVGRLSDRRIHCRCYAVGSVSMPSNKYRLLIAGDGDLASSMRQMIAD